MIQQLVQRLIDAAGLPPAVAATQVLTADPLDLVLYMERLWNAFSPPPPPAVAPRARQAMLNFGQFNGLPLAPHPELGPSGLCLRPGEHPDRADPAPRWFREYRSGEGLGDPDAGHATLAGRHRGPDVRRAQPHPRLAVDQHGPA